RRAQLNAGKPCCPHRLTLISENFRVLSRVSWAATFLWPSFSVGFAFWRTSSRLRLRAGSANNDDARMLNVEEIPNAQMTNRDRCAFKKSDVIIISSFVIRISSLAGDRRAGARV